MHEDEPPRCSDCGAPYTAGSCGLMHTVLSVQMAVIEAMVAAIAQGDRRG
jgi:hypothetical protein